jgi:hypothetical protein
LAGAIQRGDAAYSNVAVANKLAGYEIRNSRSGDSARTITAE